MISVEKVEALLDLNKGAVSKKVLLGHQFFFRFLQLFGEESNKKQDMARFTWS